MPAPVTYNAILNTEAELELEIRPLDEYSGHRRAADNTQFNLHLILQTLQHVQKHSNSNFSVYFTKNQPSVDQYLDDALTGGQRKPHKAGVINGHDLVPHIELSRASSRATVQHTGQNDCWQNGAPTRLHDHHTEALPFLFLHV